jgi:hypothetical protein
VEKVHLTAHAVRCFVTVVLLRDNEIPQFVFTSKPGAKCRVLSFKNCLQLEYSVSVLLSVLVVCRSVRRLLATTCNTNVLARQKLRSASNSLRPLRKRQFFLQLSINLHLRCGSFREQTSADHNENELKFHTAKKNRANKRRKYFGLSKFPLIHNLQSVLIAGRHDVGNANFRVKATNDPAHIIFPVKLK